MNPFAHRYYSIPVLERHRLAALVGTTCPYLDHVAHGRKRLSLGLADAVVAIFGGGLTVEDIPLSPTAERQHRLRVFGEAGACGVGR